MFVILRKENDNTVSHIRLQTNILTSWWGAIQLSTLSGVERNPPPPGPSHPIKLVLKMVLGDCAGKTCCGWWLYDMERRKDVSWLHPTSSFVIQVTTTKLDSSVLWLNPLTQSGLKTKIDSQVGKMRGRNSKIFAINQLLASSSEPEVGAGSRYGW